MATAVLRQMLLLGVLIQLSTVLATEVTFKGKEYIAYDLKSKPLGSRRNNIQLKFRTIHPTGILVYSRGSKGDFVQLHLMEGILSFRSYLGGSHITNMNIGKELADGEWHSVSVRRTGRKTKLNIDSLSKIKLVQGRFKNLNLNNFIYIGGLGSKRKQYFPSGGAKGFRGCMADVKFDGISILDGARRKAPNYVEYGSVSYHCLMEEYDPLTFLSPSSYVKLTVPKRPQGKDTFSTSFKFRTFHKEGVLISRSAIKVKMFLRLDAGSLLYDITTSNGTKALLKLGTNLDDGDWHDVNATVHASGEKVTLDGRSKETKLLNQDMLMLELANKSRLKIFAGRGDQDKYHGFVGCLMNLRIDSHKITKENLKQTKIKRGINNGKCETKNRCYPNPCRNDGKCSQDYKSFYCDCSTTEFEGPTCEDPIYKATCAEYREIGLDRDAHCLLDSDGKGPQKPYTVLCNVRDKYRTYAVIKHNKMGKTPVRNGVKLWARLLHDIQYQVGMEHIKALIDSSKKCRQYIRYDCIRYGYKCQYERGWSLKMEEVSGKCIFV